MSNLLAIQIIGILFALFMLYVTFLHLRRKEFTTKETNKLVKLADKHGLIVTGGSDYHGLDDNAEVMLGATNVPMESAEKLISLAEQRALKTPG